MKIKFCGAARNVTGSAHLLTLDNGYRILMDCGLYQGKGRNVWDLNNSWEFDPASVDAMILSHAHIDHCGRIPQLVKAGFEGDIICTHATRSLCGIMLLDSAKIQERDVEWHNKKMLKKNKGSKELRVPLYTSEDVQPAMNRFLGCSYDRWVHVTDGVDVFFADAGHILGSASVVLRVRENGEERMFGFSGDIGRPDRPILRDPRWMKEVDYLICESTYGDKEHEDKPAQSNKFLEIIKKTCIEDKGKLIIPAFSVGRTQEIVYMLDQMNTKGILPKLPVYVDSPLAVNATIVFGSHPECFDNQVHEYMLIDDNPFGFNDLTYVKDVKTSKWLNESQEPCIIISSSGMMNAGRVKHHLFHGIENPKNTFLIVGYCSPDTPGGMLKDGVDQLKLYGEWKQVIANIEVMESFSAHADRKEMLHFIHNQKDSVQTIFLVHGEIERQRAFEQYLGENGFPSVEIPELGQEYKLYA
ncbi:MBL fold metallo-hydrolase RNA specificity domain-containing protein [Portibacter marinus]|uniref:MBL fold metallo-hydrolase RNA specificity domain-containing protein n=1 Tax=Portibacter marinus TaxID=2898660 RepID=UPI001F1AE3DB|nr:MBL fold metallo-hydrolase [Portibacter marinus]